MVQLKAEALAANRAHANEMVRGKKRTEQGDPSAGSGQDWLGREKQGILRCPSQKFGSTRNH